MAARVKIEMDFPLQTATAAAAAALTISCLSEIIAPNVIDITGPISGETNMAATIFGALFSTSPSAARELQGVGGGGMWICSLQSGCAAHSTHSAVTISSR